MGDAVISRLSGAGDLRVLSVRNPRATDHGIYRLAELRNLREYYLAGTQVTEFGKRRLNNALAQLTFCASLDWLYFGIQIGARQLARGLCRP